MKKVSKKKNNINKKHIKKNIPIIASISVFLILVAITIYFLTPFKLEGNKVDNDNNPPDTSNNLLGDKRMNAQTSLINIIKEYLKDSPEIKDYVEKNAIKNLSLKELKDKFNVNTSNFENTNYGCSIENTSINFNGSYEDQVILLACDAFLID